MTYIIKSELKRNGKLYLKGDKVPEMPEKELRLLASIGTIEESRDNVQEEKIVQPVVEKINAPSIKWNRPQLIQYAKSHGVKIDDLDTKAEILEKITVKDDDGKDDGSGK